MTDRFCLGCGTDIGHRMPHARYCESRACRHTQRQDTKARRAAQQLALQLAKLKMKPTVTRTPLHGWCVRATLPHGPEVIFSDEDDLRFYLSDREAAAA